MGKFRNRVVIFVGDRLGQNHENQIPDPANRPDHETSSRAGGGWPLVACLCPLGFEFRACGRPDQGGCCIAGWGEDPDD